MGRTLVLTCALVAGIASAAPAPKTPATKLFDEGRQLAKRGQFTEACGKFGESYGLEPAVGTELNLADCEEHVGHLAVAWRMFDAAAGELQRLGDPRAKYARTRADALLPRLATIVVKIAQPGTGGMTVTIVGQPAAVAPEIREHVDPGDIAIVAAAPGRVGFEKSVQASPGATIEVEIPALGAPGSPPPVDRKPPPPVARSTSTPTSAPASTSRRRSRVYLAAGAGGLALIGGAVATVFTLRGRSLYRDQIATGACTSTANGLECTDPGITNVHAAQHDADIATGAAIAAGIFAVGAIVLFATAPRDEVMIAPNVGASGGGVSISGRF